MSRKDLYENIRELLQYTIDRVIENRYKIEIIIDNEDWLNASVEKKNNTQNEFIIKIYSGILGRIPFLLEKQFNKFDENDLLYFDDYKILNFMKWYDDSMYEKVDDYILLSLEKLFTTTILCNVIFHELGHIIAGHLNEKNMLLEYNDSEHSLYFQEKEMMADWIGVKKAFQLFFYFSGYIESEKFDCEKFKKMIKKTAVLTLLTLYLQFQIFEESVNMELESMGKYKHPHPRVRLLYSLEALREGTYDMLNNLFRISDKLSEGFVENIISEAFVYVESFFGIMDININKKIFDSVILEHYLKLRELPYSEDYVDDTAKHLCKLQDEDILFIKNYIKL